MGTQVDDGGPATWHEHDAERRNLTMTRATIIAIGFLVAILGTAGLVYQRVPYDREAAVLDPGSVEASSLLQEGTRIPPLLAGGLLVLGLGTVAYGAIRD